VRAWEDGINNSRSTTVDGSVKHMLFVFRDELRYEAIFRRFCIPGKINGLLETNFSPAARNVRQIMLQQTVRQRLDIGLE
jgi:hypothetical protein